MYNTHSNCIHCFVPSLTSAFNSNVLVVDTVVLSQAAVAALKDGTLISSAANIVQPDGAVARTKLQSAPLHTKVAKLPAHHLCSKVVPVIVTDSAPFFIVEHLHTAFRRTVSSS